MFFSYMNVKYLPTGVYKTFAWLFLTPLPNVFVFWTSAQQKPIIITLPPDVHVILTLLPFFRGRYLFFHAQLFFMFCITDGISWLFAPRRASSREVDHEVKFPRKPYNVLFSTCQRLRGLWFTNSVSFHLQQKNVLIQLSVYIMIIFVLWVSGILGKCIIMNIIINFPKTLNQQGTKLIVFANILVPL